MLLNFDHIILEREQEDLLIALVEAARKQSYHQRQKFLLLLSLTKTFIHGLADYPDVYQGDVEILAQAGLLNGSYTSEHTFAFDVTPLGFRYYEHLIKSRGPATERIEESMFRYLDSTAFATRHPNAFAKWQQAQELLWSSNLAQQHTAIGHHCREAMQFFATSLVDRFQPPNVEADITKTVKRVESVLKREGAKMSERQGKLLEAMFDYWRTLNDLVQRQEHGAQKAGDALTWEDSRRLVFQTAIVMYELDRALLNS